MNQAIPRLASLQAKFGLVLMIALLLGLMSTAVCAQKAAEAQPADAGNTPVGLSQLADMLEDDAARAKLVETLRSAAENQLKQAPAEPLAVAEQPQQPQQRAADTQKEGAAETGKAPAAAAQAAPDKSVPAVRQLAQMTRGWAETISTRTASLWHQLLALGEGKPQKTAAPMPAFDASAFWNGVIKLVLVIAATLVAFFVLRLLAGGIFSSLANLSRKGEKPGFALFMRRLSTVLLALLLDVIVVLLACGAGYVTGVLLVGDPGSIGARETLFINAFAVVELVKVGIRAVFSSQHDGLRLVDMPSSVAGWWSIRLRWFVGVIGYALLVAVPIANAQVSPALGSIIGFIVMAAAYVYALRVIFKNRKLLTQRMLTRAENASVGFFSVLLRIMARAWVLLALAYFTTLFVASQIDPAGVLPFMMAATLETLVAAAIALGLSGALSRALGKRIPVSERTRQRLPMLENRVNAYVPAGLKVARVIILVLFAVVLADAWHVFDLEGWVATAAGAKLISVVFHLLVVFAVAIVLWIVAASILEHKLGSGPDGSPASARQQTLMVLIRNALAIVVITMTVMVALSQIGVDIGPLLAGAGVIGLAIGFGSQKLVADVITGVFIQLENAMNTGDVVTLAGVTGTAEKLTIRSVSVRDISGTLHIVPFSSASVVSNYMREFGYHTYSYRIAYREDIDDAIRHLRAAFEDLQSDAAMKLNLLEDIAIPGVTSLAENAVEIRVMIKTLPGSQWAVGRAYNRLVKMHFDAAGIQIPTAHRTLYFGRDKEGWSPPARVRMVDTAKVPLRSDVDASGALDTSAGRTDAAPRDSSED